MTDQWDGWPDDDLPDGGVADLPDPDAFGEAAPWDAGWGHDDPWSVPGPGAAFEQWGPAEVDVCGADEAGEVDVGGDAAAGGAVWAHPAAADPWGEQPDGVAGLGAAGEDSSDGWDARPTDGQQGWAARHPEVVGADPDLDGYGGPWGEPGGDPLGGFPDPLWWAGLPEPVDGLPWADADLLGDAGAGVLPDLAVPAGVPGPAELCGYAGLVDSVAESGWAGLLASSDPAVSALARFWSAGG